MRTLFCRPLGLGVWIMLAVAIGGMLGGCAASGAEQASSEWSARAETAKQARLVREREMLAQHDAKQAERGAFYEGLSRRQAAASVEAAEQQRRAQQAECAESRAQRLKDMEAQLGARARLDAIEQWHVDNCKIIDRSKPVLRWVQDARGEWHLMEGRDRGVDEECLSKPPADVAAFQARVHWDRSTLATPILSDLACKELDLAVSPIAIDYWSHRDKELKRKTAEEHGPH